MAYALIINKKYPIKFISEVQINFRSHNCHGCELIKSITVL